jgi:hypothetical protein
MKVKRQHSESRNITSALKAAGQRIGSTPADRLKWLIRFKALDLVRLTSRERFELGCEILAFAELVGHMPGVPTLLPLSLPHPPTNLNAAARLQRELQRGLDKIFHEEGTWNPPSKIDRMEVRRWPSEMERMGTSIPVVFRRQAIDIQYHARWPDRFWLAVACYLNMESRLQPCKRCRNLFVANKRQEYCSRRCSQTTRTELYRRRRKDRETVRSTAERKSAARISVHRRS